MSAAKGRPPVDLQRARRSVNARVREAPSLFLAIDYDGTLTPIVARPEMARPTEETLEVLASLSQTPGILLAVVSGRSLEVLRRFIPLPQIILSGLHGLEIWPQVDRTASRTDIHAVRADLERLLLALREKVGSGKAPRIEDKRHALAFHFRGEKPAVAARMRKLVREAFDEIKEGASIKLVPGKQVLEARALNVNKGESTRSMWEQLAPASLPIVFGDDVTDEDLFEAFAKEGITVRVGRGARRSEARYFLKSPADVLAWLREIVEIRRAPSKTDR
jgi:trehalose 6-phosphate phosphatase